MVVGTDERDLIPTEQHSESILPRWLKIIKVAEKVVALFAVAYFMVTVVWNLESATRHYTTHLYLIIVLVLLHSVLEGYQKQNSHGRRAFIVSLAAFGFMCATISLGYFYFQETYLNIIQPFYDDVQVVIGGMAIAGVLSATYLVWGMFFFLVTSIMIPYFFYGYLIPGQLGHVEIEPATVMGYLAGMGNPSGIFWLMGLSADMIWPLLVFGAMLRPAGVIDVFLEMGRWVGGKLKGGIGYSAVIASLFIGMVTGQAIANIVLSGSLTIPAMKEKGFPPNSAGAIEVLSSCGSQLMPPIMGLGAFMMAMILGRPYIEVAAAAVISAFVYFFVVMVGIYFMVRALDIPKIVEPASGRFILLGLPPFIISMGTVIVLLFLRYSGAFCALVGIIMLIVLGSIRGKSTRPTFTQWIDGLRAGAVSGAQLAIILAAIGIVNQTFITTGLGNVVTTFMNFVAEYSVLIALLVGMVICVMIGMGLPTPAAYALIAITVVPALIDIGIPALSAHFFGFFFAIFSAVSPPVAVGCMTACKISQGTFFGTCLESMKMSLVLFFLPFAFIWAPSILSFPDVSLKTLFIVLGIMLASVALAMAIYGYFMSKLYVWERLLLAIGVGGVVAYLYYKNPLLIALLAVLLAFITIRQLKHRFFQPMKEAPSNQT